MQALLAILYVHCNFTDLPETSGVVTAATRQTIQPGISRQTLYWDIWRNVGRRWLKSKAVWLLFRLGLQKRMTHGFAYGVYVLFFLWPRQLYCTEKSAFTRTFHDSYHNQLGHSVDSRPLSGNYSLCISRMSVLFVRDPYNSFSVFSIISKIHIMVLQNCLSYSRLDWSGSGWDRCPLSDWRTFAFRKSAGISDEWPWGPK